ncbi:hypothetical protein C8A01DRAFT_20076 [Parachaetomium inaequale]|uniref:Uncharacterized protein n=1 Tax=Parachaetomium inaequale TaxID=2588326 RepID=A0AAN6SLM1_9PEZI|nr:hypothetical protein C8A01DRAFT_20076 [Parachaetomium inaequale]
MSWLRSVGSPLGRGAQCLLQGSPAVPAWRASTAATTPVRRIATNRTTQAPRPISRSFSTHKPANTTGQTSRFRRSEASTAETPVSAAGEDAAPETDSSATAAGQSAPTPRPFASPTPRPQPRPHLGSQAPPEPRKPVDTSSKEYKQAASKYVRFVVALPILLVTSYFLYQRHTVEAQLKLRIITADSPPSQEPSSEN